jgi:NDP-sugar pyrophosphorylase family protein
MIQDHFGNGEKLRVNIRYIHETKRMGTAGALGLLPDDVKGPFLVMNGDIITKVNFTRMLEFHREHGVTATMGVRKYDFQIPFGVVKTENGRITQIDEKPLHSFMVSAGIYLLEKECLKHIPAEDYFDMPQLFDVMMKSGEASQAFPIHEYWLDIGRETDLNRAQLDHEDVK